MTTNELTPKDKQELREKEQTREGRYYVPDVDIYENDQALWLRADMPGVDQQHVEVELENNVVTLLGQVSLQEYDGLSPLYTEYNVGHYQRRFTVGDVGRFDGEHIEARMTNGVLELKIPKARKALPRRIAVSAS